ncbi:MAG: hypothetical protein KAV82_12075, partial [Phycisphaerae bacterium]|nr:hypothetical protein [Phycisphaerae bacterium]
EMRKSGSTDLERRSAMLFIRTIQDAFLLMLRNVDKGINNPVMSQGEIPRIAAALTANLIDFADSNEMPTRIEEIGLDGTPANHFHYGLERQPFITEVYTKVEVEPDGESGYRIIPHLSFSAVELYNPYNEDLHLVPVAPATVFTLRVNNGISDTDIALSGVIPARSFAVVVNNGSAASHGGVSGTSIADAALGLLQGGWTIQLIRGDGSPTSHTIVLDQFDIDSGSGFYGGTVSSAGTIEESQERAMWRMGPAGSGNPSSYWTAVVPLTQAQQNTHSLPGVNNWKGDYPGEMQMIRPVQVDFANAGNMLESFPTTGTLLLLMRYANTEVTPFNAKLTSEDADIWKRKQFQIDNGRMPVFDVAGKHRKAQTGSLELSNATDQNPLPMGYQFLPWGQYVFDYFTALPLDHRFGPAEDVEDPDAPTEPVNILPEVDLAGARVYGRINLNAAPWTVLSGLPLVPWEILPGSYKDTIHQFTYYPGYIGEPSRDLELFIGEALGKAIVAYRDARRIPGSPAGGEGETGSFQARDPHYSAISPSYDLCPPGGSAIEFGELRKGSGFLTVGELANVRHWEVELDDVQDGTEGTLWRIDGGVVGRRYSAGVFTNYPAEDYVQAVGLLVALGDWVTTRSNVWTIYGTLRGDRSAVRARIISDGGLSSPGELAAAGRVADERINKRAIRFQETVDRLPSFLKPGSPPRRIGERKVGAYNDMRSE